MSEVVNDKTSRRKRSLPENCLFDNRTLPSAEIAQENNLTCYITAELNSSLITNEGYEFNIGDGKNYGGYNNTRLTVGVEYLVSIGVIITIEVLDKNDHHKTSL